MPYSMHRRLLSRECVGSRRRDDLWAHRGEVDVERSVEGEMTGSTSRAPSSGPLNTDPVSRPHISQNNQMALAPLPS